MTGRKLRRAARLRRGALRIACVLLAVASAPITSPAARASADAGVAAVATQLGAFTALSPPADIEAASAALVKDVEDYNRREAETARQAKKLVTEAEQITKESAAYNKDADTYNSKEAAVGREVDGFNARSTALDSRISAHNSKPSTFQLPDEAAAARAYADEANALNAEKSQLEAEKSTIQSEQSQLDEQEARLSAEKERLSSAVKAHDEQVSALQSDEQQLESRGQDLLQQMAAAMQSLADNPPDAAAAMDQGGDAAAPTLQSDQSASQAVDAAAGGDSASRLPQQAALQAYAKSTGSAVDMQPGTAFLSPSAISALPDSQAAQLTSPAVSYDGLVRNSNGTYTALEVQTPGAPSPAQAALDAATRSGRTTAVTTRGRTYVIADVTPVPMAPVPSPSSGGTPSPSSGDKADCVAHPRGERSGGGWILYTAEKVDHVNKETSEPGPVGTRAGEAQACLTSPLATDGTEAGGDITGRLGADKKAPRNSAARCHLIARALGGKGDKKHRANLFPCWQLGADITSFGMRPYETLVAKAVEKVGPYGELPAGAAVSYVVKPLYKDATSTIPWAVTMTATIQLPNGAAWPLFFPDTVENVPFTVDGVSAGPGSRSDGDQPRDCTRNGRGWVEFADTDPDHGKRAQGVQACLTRQYLATHNGSETNSMVRPPGYSWAQAYARHLGARPEQTINNCHLLGKQLSGSGTDLHNLDTCGRDANTYPEKGGLGAMDNMVQFENQVRALVENDDCTAAYQVVPVYKGKRVVPESFSMTVALWDASGNYLGSKHRGVGNLANTPRGWKNLGTVTDNRLPNSPDVPLH